MNYRHIYHAGNFADVMKHIIIIMLLEKLKEKDKAFTILDAFAGMEFMILPPQKPKRQASMKMELV